MSFSYPSHELSPSHAWWARYCAVFRTRTGAPRGGSHLPWSHMKPGLGLGVHLGLADPRDLTLHLRAVLDTHTHSHTHTHANTFLKLKFNLQTVEGTKFMWELHAFLPMHTAQHKTPWKVPSWPFPVGTQGPPP